MIPRYSREEMSAIWSEENKFRTWLQIEIHACEANSKLGKIPESAVENIKKKADFNVAKIDEIEKKVKHDVIAFLTNVAEYVGEDSRFIHLGLTSSDVLDTSLAIRMKEAADLILNGLEKLGAALKKRAIQHKMDPMIGRSHGIHAEPTTFGLKMALWYAENERNIERMKKARTVISVGQVSGAVGAFGNIDPYVEEYVCEACGLEPAPISTQVIQRDRHAEYMCTLSLIAAMMEKISVEVRHLQRTEVLEAEEYFSKGQKGSSAMPHKRNPIVSEQMSGLARLVRTNAMASIENIALWHERDISHSSVERIIVPDTTILIDYMLNKMTNLVENLLVYPETMMKNLEKMGGLTYSESILLALTGSGLSREASYALVQRNAMKVWEEGGDFEQLILADKEIMERLTEGEVKESFDLKHHLSNVDKIFSRVFGNE